MTPCAHCGILPERRLDPTTGRRVFACPNCRHRGEVTTCERGAAASWELINDPDMTRHTCKAATLPRYFEKAGKWGARCLGCGHQVEGYGSISGARAGWARSMR
jgi:hypothetical protein